MPSRRPGPRRVGASCGPPSHSRARQRGPAGPRPSPAPLILLVLSLPVLDTRCQVLHGPAELRRTDACHFLAAACHPSTLPGCFPSARSHLAVQCTESEGTPVVAAGQVAPRAAPRTPPARPSAAVRGRGAGTSQSRVFGLGGQKRPGVGRVPSSVARGLVDRGPNFYPVVEGEVVGWG